MPRVLFGLWETMMKYLILVTLLMSLLLLAAGCNSPSAPANSKPDLNAPTNSKLDPNSGFARKGNSA